VKALLEVWPILTALTAAGFGLLGWIGLGVWRVSRWTADHDSRVARLSDDTKRLDTRVDKLETRMTQVEITQASHASKIEAMP